MSARFNGTINVDIRDSVPDWAPFVSPTAPDGGFSAMSCYGGPIATPNIGKIAAEREAAAMLMRK